MSRTTVLYVGGCGRSGSTLLDRVLGALPGFVAVGELVHLVQRGLVEDERCGCGQPFHECGFWSPVIERALGDGAFDVQALGTLQHHVDRNRHIPRLLVPGLAPGHRDETERWAATLGALYGSIAAEAGASVVVDSSKHASTAFLLRRVPGIDLRVVHLVRDARGMAYSWTKAVTRPEATDEERSEMRRHRPERSAGRWLAYNGLFEVLAATTDVPVTRVIYEDFVRHPRRELDRILDRSGIDVDRSYPFLGDGWVDLGPGHSVSGNPMRFSTGRTDLRVDAAWREAMAPTDRRVVTGITLPMLAAYGYLGVAPVSALDTPPDAAPTVSVVIATRDRPQLLARALAAVRACRYAGEVEVVLVFDQSEPDRSLAGEGVRVIANDRSPGLAGARNSGITAAVGELVAFCDDDDEWLPAKLELQVPALLARPDAVLATTGIFVRVSDGDGNAHTKARVLAATEITHGDLLRSRLMEAHPSTFLVRRAALLGDLGLVDEELPGSYAEDYDLLLRASRAVPVVAVPVPLTVVHWHPSSFFFERWRTMDHALEHLLAKHPDFAQDPAGLARIEGQQALARAGTSDRAGSRAKALSALRHDWRQPRGYLGLLASTGLVGPDKVLKAAQLVGKGF